MESNKAYQPLLRICSYDHGGYVAWGWWKGWDGPGGLKDYMRRSIQRLDQFSNLKWGFHIEGATWDWALANDPVFVSEFKEWVNHTYAGRISLSSGGYGQPLSCTIGEESNIRHLTYDWEVYKRLGYRINIYMQNEHGFFPQLPQLLRQVGINKAILRTVWGMYGIPPEINASKIRWRSPEGSWVEAIPTYIGGNRGLGKNTWDTRIIIGLEGYIDFEPFRRHYLEQGIRYPVAVRIDDYPLPRDNDGSGGFNRFCAFSDMPGYRWVTGEEAFEEIPLEDAILDTVIDDYPIQMPWGFQGNIFWSLSRQAENSILMAERLAAINTLHKGAAREEMLERAWKKLLTAQHHDINICGVSSGGEYGELMLDVAKDFYGEAIVLANTVTKASLRAILCNFKSHPSDRVVVVYNPSNWARSSVVSIQVKSDSQKLPKDFKIIYDGQQLDYQVIHTEIKPGGYISYILLAVQLEVEPLGFALLNLDFLYEKAHPAQAMEIVETDREITVYTNWGKVTVDEETGEHIPYDLHGKPLLIPGNYNCMFTAFVNNEPCSSIPEHITIEANGPIFSVIRTVGKIGSVLFTTDVTIYKDDIRLDFKTTQQVHGETVGETNIPSEWDGKDEPMVQEKKLMVHFTPALNGKITTTQDFPFSVGETHNYKINAGCWVDTSDGNQGMTLLNRGTMGYLWDGRTLSNILLYSGKYSWGEVQAYLDGSYTQEYSVSFHKGNWKEGRAHQIGLEYNMPVIGLSGSSRNGILHHKKAKLSILDAVAGQDCSNIVVSALYTQNNQLYIRLYEFFGKPETAIRLIWANQPTKIIPVNLLHEHTGKAIDSAVIPAYAIRTFLLLVNKSGLDESRGEG